jgi:Icc-related predicted phosphoesterase
VPPFIKTRLLILSDTHGLHRDLSTLIEALSTQKADVAIHCGGLTRISNMYEYNSAIKLLGTINAPLKLVIPGKSDFSLYADEEEVEETRLDWLIESRKLFAKAKLKHQVVLHQSAGTHEVRLANGAYLRYFVAPYKPEPHIDTRFAIEEDTDIAVTYVPPYAILDQNAEGTHVGSPELLGAIAMARPSLHCFGQAHESWGVRMGTWLDDEDADGELLVEEILLSIEDNQSANETKRGPTGGFTVSKSQGPQGDEPFRTLFVNASTMDADHQLSRPCCVVDLHLPGQPPDGWRGQPPDDLRGREYSSGDEMEIET